MNKIILTTAFTLAALSAGQAFATGNSSTVTTSGSSGTGTTTTAVAPTTQRDVPTVAQYLSPVSQAPVASKVSTPTQVRPVEKQHQRHPQGMRRHPGAVNATVAAKAS